MTRFAIIATIACAMLSASCTSQRTEGAWADMACTRMFGSCPTSPVPQVVGGSAADAKAVVGFTHKDTEIPNPDWAQGARNAADACRQWGYEQAVRTGPEQTRCIRHSSASDGTMGCRRREVVVIFRCLGTADNRTPIE